MFLKSLTIKGFKSFAEPTMLDFEPGVTVVVGPNGSGKSNIVDAVAWVLGAQGPRALRSSKMDDVIFAGSGKRPALGRAEVSLTIDNSAGLLPIAFTEVTITRTLFRSSGESEYAINGVSCRLLDVQELLSDSGLRRDLSRLDDTVAAAEAALAATDSSGLGDLVGRAEALRERARGLGALLAERRRGLERDRSAFVDHTLVAALEAEAARVAGELSEVDAAASELLPESDRLEGAEFELAGERAEFDARFGEGVSGPTGHAAEVRGELTALRASVDAGRGEMSRLEIRLDALEERG